MSGMYNRCANDPLLVMRVVRTSSSSKERTEISDSGIERSAIAASVAVYMNIFYTPKHSHKSYAQHVSEVGSCRLYSCSRRYHKEIPSSSSAGSSSSTSEQDPRLAQQAKVSATCLRSNVLSSSRDTATLRG